MATEIAIQVYRFLPCTEAEGPGRRACLWVQGCSIRCPDCFVPQTWSQHGGTRHSVTDLARTVISLPDIDGITFMGGEPFDQAGALAELAMILRSHGLSIVTFTGHCIEDIRAKGDANWDRLLSATDLLIDGPFIKHLESYSRPWVGSTNQCYHVLTGRLAAFKEQLLHTPNQLEVRIGMAGQVDINGIACQSDIQDIIQSVSIMSCCSQNSRHCSPTDMT